MGLLRIKLLLILIALSGCATTAKHQRSALTEFDNGRPEQAIAAFQAAMESRKAERELLAVDSAIASIMAGQFRDAETSLTKARHELDYLRQDDIREQATSVLTDDKAIAWSGRDFEQRMIDNLLILSSLLGDRQDAFAFASQVSEHVNADRNRLQPEEPTGPILAAGHTNELAPPIAPLRLRTNAFAAYLMAAVSSESPMNSDTTKAALDDVTYWNTNNRKVLQSGFGVDSQPGHGVIHVITFAGRITDWIPETIAPTSAALLLADQILSNNSDHSLPPTVAPVRIAKPAYATSRIPFVTKVRIDSNKQPVVGQTLVDLNQVAEANYQHDKNGQIARAVVRRVIKKAAVYATKDQLSVNNNSGADVLLTLGGIAWEALEKPDARHLSLLPERIEVLQIEATEGEHTIEVGTEQHNQAGWSTTTTVNVQNGRNTVVLCFRPKDKIVRVVTQQR